MTDRFWILYRELVQSVGDGPTDLNDPDPLRFVRDSEMLSGLRSYLTVWRPAWPSRVPTPGHPPRGETYPYELAQ